MKGNDVAMKKITKKQFLETMKEMGRMNYRAYLRTEAVKKQLETILKTIEAGETSLLVDILLDTDSFNSNVFEITKITDNDVRYHRKETDGKVVETGINLKTGDEFYSLGEDKVALFVANLSLLFVYSRKEVEPYSIDERRTTEFYLEKIRKNFEYGLYFNGNEIPSCLLTVDLVREGIKMSDSFLRTLDPQQITREMLDIYQELSIHNATLLLVDRVDLFTDEEIIELSLINEEIIRKVEWSRLENGLLQAIMDAWKENKKGKLDLTNLLSVEEELKFKKKYGKATKKRKTGMKLVETYADQKEDENFENTVYRITIKKTNDGEEEPLITWLFDYMGEDIHERKYSHHLNSFGSSSFTASFYSRHKENTYDLFIKPGNKEIGQKVLETIKTQFNHLGIEVEVEYRDELTVEKFYLLVKDFLAADSHDLEGLNQLKTYYHLLPHNEQGRAMIDLKEAYSKVFTPYENKKVEMELDITSTSFFGTFHQQNVVRQGTIKRIHNDFGYGLFPKGSRNKYIPLDSTLNSIKEIKKFD